MSGKIISFIATETSGDSFVTYKFCFEKTEVPSVIYDDTQQISFKRYGETAKQNEYIDLTKHAQKIQSYPPLFRYFLDGSRRTYKIDDISYNHRIYPIVAGQIGVGCCERPSPDTFKVKKIESFIVISLPDCADKDGKGNLFFNNLTKLINNEPYVIERNIRIQKTLHYSDRDENDKYENRAIATIQDEMISHEKKIVVDLVKENALNEEAYLIKDGSLEYASGSDDYRDLSIIKSNYRRVIGVSKSFSAEKCLDAKGKSNAAKIANLPLYHRTPAYMYEADRVGDVRFAIWYLRLRDAVYTASPFAGIIKVQKILVTNQEQQEGLESSEIDLISSNLINERNPVCYGSDNRWANHLYPVFLTETFIKSKYLSDSYFLNLF